MFLVGPSIIFVMLSAPRNVKQHNQQPTLSDSLATNQIRRRYNRSSDFVTFSNDSFQLLMCGGSAKQEVVQGLIKVVLVFNRWWRVAGKGLKDVLTNASILVPPRAIGHYTVDTDSCDNQMASCGYISHPKGAPEQWILVKSAELKEKRTRSNGLWVPLHRIRSTLATPLSWRELVYRPNKPRSIQEAINNIRHIGKLARRTLGSSEFPIEIVYIAGTKC